MRLRGNLIVLMFTCWKIHVRETAEIQDYNTINTCSLSLTQTAMVQLLCHQKKKNLKQQRTKLSNQFKRHSSGRLVKNHELFRGKTSWNFTMPLIKNNACTSSPKNCIEIYSRDMTMCACPIRSNYVLHTSNRYRYKIHSCPWRW